MKISILYKFRASPWGGTNQFLKALKKEFINRGVYEENLAEADVILFNSYPFGSEHFFYRIFKLKQNKPEKLIIYRLDGPIFLYRDKDRAVDKIIAHFNKLLVDGIVFQSSWCREQNKRLYNISSKYETVIYNAVDNDIFNKNIKKDFNPNRKIKLIATSWSSNWSKGFEIYSYLDENLDFSKYEITFVGNSPVEFKNIRWIRPVPSEKLAEILKQQDIYIIASKNDPCSNSLIEALSCGMTAVALNSGGHSELIKESGELFNSKEEIIEKIEKVAQKYSYYQNRIPEFSIRKVAKEYYDFAQRIYNEAKTGRYQPKQVNRSTKINFYKMKVKVIKWKSINRLEVIKEKCKI